MTYDTSKRSRYATIPAVVALALVSFTGGSIITDTVSAETKRFSVVVNNKIKVGRGKLKRACKNSGGKFDSEKGSDYGCAVHRKDGSSTNIHCKKSGECSGTNRNPA